MSNRLTNGPGPWLVSSEIEIDLNNNGVNEVQTWEGSEAEVAIKQNALISAGATKLRRVPKGDGDWQVRAAFPFDTQGQNPGYVDVMELEVNAIMRSCYQSAIYRKRFADVDAITGDSLRARATLPVVGDCARKYLNGLPKVEESGANSGKYKGLNPNTGEVAYFETRELAVQGELGARLTRIAITTARERNSAIALFENVAFRGVTSFIEYNHVFRRRVTAGSPQAVSANQTGGGMIWTTAEVVAFEGIPNNGWFSLPPDVQWHKDKPRVLKSYGQKTEISYAYTEIVTASALFYEAHDTALLIDNF